MKINNMVRSQGPKLKYRDDIYCQRIDAAFLVFVMAGLFRMETYSLCQMKEIVIIYLEMFDGLKAEQLFIYEEHIDSEIHQYVCESLNNDEDKMNGIQYSIPLAKQYSNTYLIGRLIPQLLLMVDLKKVPLKKLRLFTFRIIRVLSKVVIAPSLQNIKYIFRKVEESRYHE